MRSPHDGTYHHAEEICTDRSACYRALLEVVPFQGCNTLDIPLVFLSADNTNTLHSAVIEHWRHSIPL